MYLHIFLVYSSEAILPVDIAFRAPRVVHYNEEQAIVVRTENVDRAKEECLITCVRKAKYLEGYKDTRISISKVVHFWSTTSFSIESRKPKGCTSSPPLGRALLGQRGYPTRVLPAMRPGRNRYPQFVAHRAPYTFLSLKRSRYVLSTP